MNLLLHQSASWDAVPQPVALIGLVDQVGYGNPYRYQPGAIAPAVQWLPDTCRDTDLIFTAYDMAVSAFPDLIGYCIMKPYTTYARFGYRSNQYGVEPETCIYIAELGIAEQARGHRIGSILLDFATSHCPPQTRSYLVRTMVNQYDTDEPNPAIAFYQKRGFVVVEDQETQQPLIEVSSQRPRLFLRRAVGV